MPLWLDNVDSYSPEIRHVRQTRFRAFCTSLRAGPTLNGGLQVLVLGHWNPSSVSWFGDARVDNFRDGQALVPARWLEGDSHLGDKVALLPI